MASNTNYFAMEDDYNEFEMWQGLRGPYFQPHVAEDGTLSWTNNGGLPNPNPITIEGHDGAPGFSPTVEIQQIQGGHRVIITDEDGPHSFDVIDYMEGRAIQSTVLNADYTLTIRYTDGTSYTTPSIRGATGATGADGADGTDGVSPEVTITTITGGHRVKITDADHPQGQSFDVMDGTSQGGLPAGGTNGAYLMKTSSEDYAAAWTHPAALAPQMDGTAFAGSSSNLSRGDHVHPTDTSRASAEELAVVIDGNIAQGSAMRLKFAIVKNSTIQGISDGIYQLAKAVSANTVVDSTYFSPYSDSPVNNILNSFVRTTTGNQVIDAWVDAAPQYNQYFRFAVRTPTTNYLVMFTQLGVELYNLDTNVREKLARWSEE